jgi:hypothetical protein
MSNWKSPELLRRLINDRTTGQIDAALAALPIVDPEDYHWDYAQRRKGNWRPNHLHWLPVGLRRGNGGQVRLAGEPMNPIAERLINGMEAIIELERLRELAKDPNKPPPSSPRNAVLRYFGLPRLDMVEQMDVEERRALQKKIDEVRGRLVIRLAYENKSSQFAITIRDHGMGQSPKHLHHTLLSLGESDKPDKPYLIGLFGQGGSSAFMASKYSVVLSRRAGDILGKGEDPGVGWSIVKQIIPKGRRDPYFAYLAADEDGTVPSFDAEVADKVCFEHGSQFSHINYDFGGAASAISRILYQSLNHVLFNPVLPYDLYAIKDKPDLMQGTAQRLARRIRVIGAHGGKQSTLDKSFAPQAVA